MYEAYCVFEIVGIFRGDPHLQTADGHSYTFNGLGEYVLLKSAKAEIQVRTDQAWSSTNQPSSWGSVFSAVAARVWYEEEESNEIVSSSRVHVEMPADRTSGTAGSVYRGTAQIKCHCHSRCDCLLTGDSTSCHSIFFWLFVDLPSCLSVFVC